MHDPNDDKAKGQGEVQAASTHAGKSNPIQGVYVIDKDKSGQAAREVVPVTRPALPAPRTSKCSPAV